MSTLFESTVVEVFSRFDLRNRKLLCYPEFSELCEVVGRPMDETAWLEQVLPRVQSTWHLKQQEQGVTLNGLKRWLVAEIEANELREEFMFEWLNRLGYDEQLFPTKCRCFMLSVHSDQALSLKAHDAISTDVDARANLLIAEKFGQFLEQKPAYDILFTFSEQILGYSYFVINKLAVPIELTLDFSRSLNMSQSSSQAKITKRIEAQCTEFMMHTRALPNALDFSRSIKITLREIRGRVLSD